MKFISSSCVVGCRNAFSIIVLFPVIIIGLSPGILPSFGGVPMILDRVFGPSGDPFRDLSPFVPKLLFGHDDENLQSLLLGGLAKRVHGHEEKKQVEENHHKPHSLGDKFGLHLPHLGLVDDSTRTYLWVMVEMDEKGDYGNSHAQSFLLLLP
nr:hypothetical protein Iba_chr08cCG8560 [Ipomoea batatas]